MAGKWSFLVDPQATPEREPLMVRIVGLLFVFGGVLGLVSLLLPHPAKANDAALFAIDGISFAVGIGLVGLPRRIPLWLLHVLVGGSAPLICSAIYFTGIAAGLYAWMFVWIVLFTAVFFSTQIAIFYLLWVLACYAATLSLVDNAGGYSAMTRWLLSAMALGVASGLTCWLVARRRVAEERSEHFFNLSRDMLCTANADGYFVEVNPAWTATLGYSPEELLSKPFVDLVHPDDRERTASEAARIFEDDAPVSFENRYRAKDGTWHWLRWSSKLSPQQGVIYARATDITERKQLEAERESLIRELDAQARTDSLTGLPNRRSFGAELERELARARRQGSDFCLALIDLDRFKQFNDRNGHQAGDDLLREASGRWRATLRVTDFLARYCGEEFVALFPDCPAADARAVVDRVRAATPKSQTCSAGIAIWDHEETALELIARADRALYAAKSRGRDRAEMDVNVRDRSGVGSPP